MTEHLYALPSSDWVARDLAAHHAVLIVTPGVPHDVAHDRDAVAAETRQAVPA